MGYHEPEEVGLNAVRMNIIDSIVAEGLAEKAFPGCQVLVAKNGMVIYNKSFGYYTYEGKQQVNNHSVYDLASVSKAAGTLPAVMIGYDRKMFNLSSKIGDFVPQFKGSNKEQITIRELLFHQSGVTPTINFYLKTIDKSSYQGSLYSKNKDAGHPVRFDGTTWVRNDFKFLPGLGFYNAERQFYYTGS